VPTYGHQKCPLDDTNEAQEHIRCRLHEEQGRFLGAKGHHKLSDIEHGGDEKGTCRICVYSIDTAQS
jgi:hypothetical protein